MSIPVRIKGTTTRVSMNHELIEYYASLPEEEAMQSDNDRWKWWELAVVAFIFLVFIFAVFSVAEAQIVRGMV